VSASQTAAPLKINVVLSFNDVSSNICSFGGARRST